MRRSTIRQGRKRYGLTLSDGTSWQLMGFRDNAYLADQLGTIIELDVDTCNDSPKLIFSKPGNINDAIDEVNDVGASKSLTRCSDAEWISYDYETLCIWYHHSIADVICEVKNNEGYETKYINMWISLQPIYQRSIGIGGLPFHAGLIEIEGRGVLLAAPGGTGKSTCCRRLPDYWKPLCDDETLVVLDKQKNYRAHPFPTWSNYLLKRAENTWNVQSSVPLSGVFFLERSENDEDKVVPVGEGEAAFLMTRSAIQVLQRFWRKVDREDQKKFKRKFFNNACEMAKVIPAFILRISPTGCFWEEIEKVL